MKESIGISRRSFLKGGMLAAAGAGAAGVGLVGCTKEPEAAAPVQSEAPSSAGGSVSLNPQDYDYTSNSITDWANTALFSSWKLGPFELSHRMVKSAAFQLAFMSNNPDEYISYYERMAKGGVEMIWIEDFANNWEMTNSPFRHPYEEIDVRGLVDTLHALGAHVGTQFDTMGSAIGPLDFTEPFLADYSTEDVKSWVDEIVKFAAKLHSDGFDAYELNFAANNVGQSFLSRVRNNRSDEYGPQSLESRTRFAVECIKGVKEACGSDFVVQVLINGVEENDQVLGANSLHTSIEETKAIAKILEEAGADSLHVRLGPAGAHVAQFANDLYFAARGLEGSTGFGGRFDFSQHFQGKLRASHSGCGMMIDVASEIKSAVGIPVGAATYMDPAQAPDYFEEAIAEGKLDFLVMNRPLCVDPEYVNKLREGRLDEIAPCTRCLHCFFDPDRAGTLIEHCRVNAASWRAFGPAMPEGWEPVPASKPKKVMVVGGGPAGMEAARLAAWRGHDVTLYEKNAQLGGLLAGAEAIKGPHENLGRLRSYLAREQELRGVNVVTGIEVDASLIKQESPDCVILAVGGVRPQPAFDGVLGFDDVVAGIEAENVVMLGSNLQAIDTALYLMDQGKKLTIVSADPLDLFEKGHSVNVRQFIETAMNSAGVRVWPGATVTSVEEGLVKLTSDAGVEVELVCDAVVDMGDMLPNSELASALSGFELYTIGDAADPFNIAEAIASGNLCARSI